MNLRQETTINEVKMLLKENNIRMVYRLLGVGPSPELKKALENEEDHQIWEMFAKTNSNKIEVRSLQSGLGIWYNLPAFDEFIEQVCNSPAGKHIKKPRSEL